MTKSEIFSSGKILGHDLYLIVEALCPQEFSSIHLCRAYITKRLLRITDCLFIRKFVIIVAFLMSAKATALNYVELVLTNTKYYDTKKLYLQLSTLNKYEIVKLSKYYSFLEYFFFRCTDYKNIPSGCKVQKLAGQCCPQVVCDNNQVIVPSTTNIHNQGGGNNVVVHGPNGDNTPLLPQVFPNGTFDPHNTGVHRPSISESLI